jgi:hypothetical protein
MNPNAPFGLKPVRRLNGGPIGLQRCYISASYATALYVGDPVLFDTTLANKDATGKYPTIIASAGTTTTVTRGIIVGFEPLVTDLTKVYNPASTARYAMVAMGLDDLVCQIRDDGSGTPSKVFPGQNAEMANAGGGSTVTGLSGFTMDATTPTTTQAFTLQILGLADIENNELDDYAVWEVLLNTNLNATGRFLGVTAS